MDGVRALEATVKLHPNIRAASAVFISMYGSAMLILTLLRLPEQAPTGELPAAATLGAPAGPRTE